MHVVRIDQSVNNFANEPEKYVLRQTKDAIVAEKKSSLFTWIKAHIFQDEYKLSSIVEKIQNQQLDPTFVQSINRSIVLYNFSHKEKRLSLLKVVKSTVEERNIRQLTPTEIRTESSEKSVLSEKGEIRTESTSSEEEESVKEVAKRTSEIFDDTIEEKAEVDEKYLLDAGLYKKAITYIETPSKLDDMPVAPFGRTRVYLPKELPIVLKLSGSPANQERFEKMQEAQEVCEENEYTHLVIPQARVHGDFIIESRLPITAHEMKEQIGLYIEHTELFNDAVREFTGFICQTALGDITGGTESFYQKISSVPMGRYDNVSLYMEKEGEVPVGKIGLIDVEDFQTLDSEDEVNYLDRCKQAIYLFPYHLDIILEEVKKEYPAIEKHRKELEGARDKVLEYFKTCYRVHLDFINNNKISINNPDKIVKITQERKDEIRISIKEYFEKRYKKVYADKSGKIENLDQFMENTFPQILDAVIDHVTQCLQLSVKAKSKHTLFSSFPQLLAARTITVESSEISDRYKGEFNKVEFARDNVLAFDLLLEEIFKRLQGQEIAYQQYVGSGGTYQFALFV